MENRKNESLPKLIARKQMEIVQPFLELGYLKRVFPDFFSKTELQSNVLEQLAIEILSSMVLDLGFECKRIEKNLSEGEIDHIRSEVLPEINAIYQVAIKSVGISSRETAKYDDLAEEYRRRALNYFDDNVGRFKHIKRDFLETRGHYGFSESASQAKMDFKARLLVDIVHDQTGKKLGGQRILKLIEK
jgi:hypothetical protein